MKYKLREQYIDLENELLDLSENEEIVGITDGSTYGVVKVITAERRKE